MDKIKVISVLALAMAFATSCSQNGKFAKEIDTVDSLITQLESYQATMDSLNPDTISSNLKTAKGQFEFLKENYPDTNNRDFWVSKMSYLGQVRKGYSRFEENQADYQRQVEESIQQLEALRNSLEDEKLTEEEATRYVQDEAEAVRQIGFYTGKASSSIKLTNTMWDSIRPYFDSVTTYYRGQQ